MFNLKFLKKPIVFGLILQVTNIIEITIEFFHFKVPNGFPLISFVLIVFIYSFFYKTKFNSKFIWQSMLWDWLFNLSIRMIQLYFKNEIATFLRSFYDTIPTPYLLPTVFVLIIILFLLFLLSCLMLFVSNRLALKIIHKFY